MTILRISALVLFLVSSGTAAAQVSKPETRVRIVDQYGNTRYDLPSVKIDSTGRARVVDTYGNTRYDLPSVKVDQSGRARVVDPYGNTRYDLPSARIDPTWR